MKLFTWLKMLWHYPADFNEYRRGMGEQVANLRGEVNVLREQMRNYEILHGYDHGRFYHYGPKGPRVEPGYIAPLFREMGAEVDAIINKKPVLVRTTAARAAKVKPKRRRAAKRR